MVRNKHLLTPLAFSLPSLGSTDCSVDALTLIVEKIPNASLNFANLVAANGTFGDAAPGTNYFNATSLPALCGLSVNIRTPGDTSYNFGLFLPREWNNRFMAAGNGGWSGGVNWVEMARYSHYGFATVSTDTGHISGPDDVSWALNQPEKLINWGYRAMHGSVEAAKQIVQGYYADEIAASYYSACSNGGRQGLKEIQLYPETFDGVILAAPGWSPPRLSAFMLRQALLNAANTTGRVEADLIGAVVAEMVRQCDAQDGVKDDIISDPFGCNFDFNQLLCTPNSEGACLGAAQVETVQMLYTAYWEAGQCLVQPALSIGADASALARGHNGIGVGPFRYAILNDTDWDPATFTFDDFLKADEINPGQSVADNFDLSPFYERGGKLLIYHGYSDVLIPTSSSIQLYNNIYRSLAPKGVDVASFLRLFLVPGMNHCANSAVAPSHIGGELQTIKGATHSVPGFEDAKHDVVLAMMAWVEEGTAPSDIIATKFKGDAVGEVERQRPLCPYPARARYVGGDVDSPENWQCEMD